MMLLVASDSDNRVIVVATGLVPREDYENYRFFLEQCRKNREMCQYMDSPRTTIFVDGRGESPRAISDTFPLLRVRLCVRNMLTGPGISRLGVSDPVRGRASRQDPFLSWQHSGDTLQWELGTCSVSWRREAGQTLKRHE